MIWCIYYIGFMGCCFASDNEALAKTVAFALARTLTPRACAVGQGKGLPTLYTESNRVVISVAPVRLNNKSIYKTLVENRL